MYMKPKQLITDNGSNFVLSAKEILRMQREALFFDSKLKAIDMEKLAKKCEISLKFSPSSSSHFNGLIKRIVRSAKTALKTVLRRVRNLMRYFTQPYIKWWAK